MTELALGFFNMLTPTAAGAAPVVGGAAPVVGGSGVLQGLLQGTMTAFSIGSALAAGRADAEQFELVADDAEREKPLETLQGINRRAGIKAEMMDRIAGQDVANAASGVDLSFGTPGQARREAFREGDTASEADIGTQQTRVARLDERAANYRKRAKRARAAGVLDAVSTGLGGFGNLAKIGGP